MVDFILEIDFMTTGEFCKNYELQLPTIQDGANGLLQIDAIKHKMFVEYAKILSRNISVQVLKTNLGFTDIETRGGFPRFKNGKYFITHDDFGFWLEPYDSVDGIRLSKIGNLVGLGIFYNDR